MGGPGEDLEHLPPAVAIGEHVQLPEHRDGDRQRAQPCLQGSVVAGGRGEELKTGFPGARVGYAVADQRVAGSGGDVILLADHLSKIKSMLTVNTSPVAQAVVGGKLLAHDCSLTVANHRETAVYRGNRRQLLAGLASRFAGGDGTGGAGLVTWNSPSGGFFVVVTLPFPAGDELLEFSARQYGVLWTPMRHFYDGTGGRHQAGLAYSQLTPELIETGLDRFAALVADPRSRSAAPG
jgi:(S)-3,5-dihydroxyphenylglycine transaminase